MSRKFAAAIAAMAGLSSLLTFPAEAQTPASSGVAAPEARAIWVARWSYESPEDVRAIIDNAADHNFNIVVWQARGNATTFYRSELEPWAWELTSDSVASLGRDPGWDPLELAVEYAHERGVELHAWVNFLPGWLRTIPPPEEADQVWNTHRDWFMQNKASEVMWPQGWWDYWMSFLDPGVPEVKKHIHDVFMEIVQNYDVDGLHYDFIRYPSEVGDWAYNPISVERFKQHYKDYTDPSPENYPVQWQEWKRSQITEIVHDIYRDAKALKPNLLVSAAVVREWARGHNDYAQDWRTWMSKGILDATFPMLYIFTPENFPFISIMPTGAGCCRGSTPGAEPRRRSSNSSIWLATWVLPVFACSATVRRFPTTFPVKRPKHSWPARSEMQPRYLSATSRFVVDHFRALTKP